MRLHKARPMQNYMPMTTNRSKSKPEVEYGATKPEVHKYVSCGFRYLVEIWLAREFVIKPESGDSIDTILMTGMTYNST